MPIGDGVPADIIIGVKPISALLSIALLATLPATAQKRPLRHEDLYTLKRVSGASASPDGKWVIVSVNEPNYDAAKVVTDLWIVPTDGSAQPRRLTASKAAESGVVWSPDSKRIAFSTKREGDEAEQIYTLDMSGGEAQRVTSIAAGASSPDWRPDGKALLFESMIKGPRLAPEKSSARVFDAMPFRYWNAWADGASPHVFVQVLDGSAAVDLLPSSKLDGLYSDSGSSKTLNPIWSPDGQEVIFTAVANREAMMTEEVESHLYRVKAGGQPVQITQKGQSFGSPKFSLDGKWLLASHTRNMEKGRLYSLSRLARIDWVSGAMTLLTDGFDRSVGLIALDQNKTDVVFSAEDNGFTQLFKVPIAGGSPTRLFNVTEGNYSSPFFAGGTLLAMYSSSTQPSEVRRAGGALLTDFNRELLAQLDMPKPEHFFFTARNGKRIHSVIFFPPALDRTKKYPLVIFPHGGPNSMSGDAFSTRWNAHLLTSPGYVLLETNYTGSTGFGEKFADDIERDLLRGPAQELLEAIEEASKLYPFLDKTRQAAIGASYSGYLVNWLNGHSNQFKAFVSHAGAVNNESQYGVNDGGLDRELRMGGPIWEGKGQWMDQSPFRYADNWKTPTLITHGEQDFRVPLGEGLTTFKLLQRKKVPSRLVVFPDEGHWILKGENSKHHMQEVLGWLRKYLDQ